MRAFVVLAVFSVCHCLTAPVRADDKWELGGVAGCIDDDSSNCNQLIHGQAQTHDLQGAPGADQDWMTVETKNRRSYEVRAFNSNQPWTAPSTINTTTLDRVDAAGTVLTAGFAPDGPGAFSPVGSWQAVRWIGAADQRDFVRVQSNLVFASNANDQYGCSKRRTSSPVGTTLEPRSRFS